MKNSLTKFDKNAGPVSFGAHTPTRFCSGGIDPKLPPAFLSILALVSGLWFLVLCPAYSAVVEKVVAVVNNDVITLYDLDRALAPLTAHGKSEQEMTVLRKKVLEDLVNQKLLEQEISKSGVEVTDADLSRAIAGVLSQNHITIELLRSELSGKGISFEAYKEQLESHIRQYKFIQQNLASKVQVSSQDIQNYRKNNSPTEESPVAVRLSWIFLPFEEGASAKDRHHLVEKGQKLSDRARKGEDFDKLGGKQKETRVNELPSDLGEVVAKMEPGAVSDPIATPQGIYVIQLHERPSAAPAKSDSADDNAIFQKIFNERLEQEIHNYVQRLRKKAYVEVRQ